MKKISFLQAMQLIDDEFLEEAYVPVKKKTGYKVIAVAVAACLCIAVGMGTWNMMVPRQKTVTIDAPEYGFKVVLPDNAENVTYQIVKNDSDVPMLEASFSVEEQIYLCRVVNTAEPTDLTSTEGVTVGMMSWQNTDLSVQYREQDEAKSWVSWYDEEAQMQWCLAGENPAMLLTTAEMLVQKLGYSMAIVPSGVEQVTYKAIGYEDITVGENGFVLNGVHYAYRMAATMKIEEYFADISGVTLSGEEYTAKVLWCPARITIDADGRGKIVWFDVVPGLLYSLTMDANANEEALLDMAHRMFAPAQGDNP